MFVSVKCWALTQFCTKAEKLSVSLMKLSSNRKHTRNKWIENVERNCGQHRSPFSNLSNFPKPRKWSSFDGTRQSLGLKSPGHIQGPENQLPLLTMFLVHLPFSSVLSSRVSRDPYSGVCCMDQNLQTWKGTLADVQNRCCHICNGDLKAAAAIASRGVARQQLHPATLNAGYARHWQKRDLLCIEH